jgi:protein-tyrosine phosphatase
MAEAFLRRETARRGAEAEVSSAGFVTVEQPAERHAVKAMGEVGLDIAAHRSRVVSPELLGDPDLVIGMTREHVRMAVAARREAFARTFTLKELVRRAESIGPRHDTDVTPWVAAVADERDPHGLLGADPVDDIADPMGRSLRRFRACRDEIDRHLVTLSDLLWPPLGP